MRAFILGLLLIAATISVPLTAHSQRAPSTARPLKRYADNERGLTLNFIVNEKMWQWARGPSPETMNRIDDQVHRTPQKGVEVEILTPGDFGLTLHYRW